MFRMMRNGVVFNLFNGLTSTKHRCHLSRIQSESVNKFKRNRQNLDHAAWRGASSWRSLRFLLSISGSPIFVNIKKNTKKIKKWPMSSQDRAKKNNKKNEKKKNTKIKICVGGGGGGTNLLYLLCLISNIMPQLEQSSLQPSTYLQHRHLLQTTSYNHLLRLHLLISR